MGAQIHRPHVVIEGDDPLRASAFGRKREKAVHGVDIKNTLALQRRKLKALELGFQVGLRSDSWRNNTVPEMH
jgi:hypothetical protein